jgi:SulP family sulfate permease
VGLLDSVNQRLDDEETQVTHLILDFEHVTGVDTSALHGLAKLKALTDDRGVKLLDCAVPDSISEQFRSQTFLDGNASVELEFATSDDALEWCEDDLLRGEGINPGEDEFSFDFMLREMFEIDEHMAEFAAVLETLELAPGSLLIEAGDDEHHLDIVETGHVEVLAADGSRLRRAGPGSLLGIASFFRHGGHHSLVTIRATEACTVRRLTGDAYLDLIFDNPDVAAGLQRHALVLLSDRFDRTLGTLQRVLRSTS